MAAIHDVQVDKMAFPVELPMLPGNIIAPWLRPVGLLQVMARLHFDHAVVRRALLHLIGPTGSYCLAKAGLTCRYWYDNYYGFYDGYYCYHYLLLS